VKLTAHIHPFPRLRVWNFISIPLHILQVTFFSFVFLVYFKTVPQDSLSRYMKNSNGGSL